MCPQCEGRGKVSDIDLSQLYDESLSLSEGAITVPGYKAGGWSVRQFSESGFFDPDKPVSKYTKTELHDFLHKEPVKVKLNGINVTYEGLVPKVRKSFFSKDPDSLQPHIREFVDRAAAFTACPECGGTRLSKGALSSKIKGINIADACAMQISDLAEWVEGVDEPRVAPLLHNLTQLLGAFVEIGLGYLSLDRAAGTLSGGEAQRTKMIRHLGSALTDVTYVFDEPTVGLHPHDIQRMNVLLEQLRDKGNTVLVVEHKPEVIEIADHVVDLGPGGNGRGRGRLRRDAWPIFEPATRLRAGTSTIVPRSRRRCGPAREPGRDPAVATTTHNLRDVDVDIPLGLLCVVTGVAGSGKTSLIHGSIPPDAEWWSSTRTPFKGRDGATRPPTPSCSIQYERRSPRPTASSRPFSAPTRREPVRPVTGPVSSSPSWDSWTPCPPRARSAKGSDPADVLEYKLGGKDISQVLEMSVDEAEQFFSDGEAETPAAHKILERMNDVGLGYLTLGQPLPTLSGGERQRLKLATRIGEKGGIYVLDEPTSGLHLADVDHLLGLLDRLVDAGKSVIVIEHHQAVMAHADWIIDLGPGAGHDGGRVVFEGTPSDLIAGRSTLTAQHLAAYVGK